MSKYLLAFDTAGNALSIGIARYTGRSFSTLAASAHFGLGAADAQATSVSPYEMLADENVVAPRQANTLLLERIDSLLYEHEIDLGDIAAVVVGRGPGSFTGVRIGVATAKGLARGLKAPLYGVSTTDAIACALAAQGYEGWACIALDAMRKEIYPAVVHIERGQVQRVRGDYVGKPAEVMPGVIAELVERGFAAGKDSLRVLGSGLEKHYADIAEAFEAAAITCVYDEENANHVTGEGLIRAHIADYVSDPYANAGEIADVLPIYTRMSDAEEAEKLKSPSCEASSSRPRCAAECSDDARPTATQSISASSANDAPHRITVRQLNPSDLDAMIALEKRLEHSAFNAGLLAHEFDVMHDVWMGAFSGAQLVGYVGIANMAGEVHVLNIAVDSAYRRKGVARQMMEAAKQRVLAWKASCMTLEVRVSNTPAINLYESLGFKEEGVRPHYYRDGEDASIMWLVLVDEKTALAWWGSEAYEQRRANGARVLGFESSCDETAAAIVEGNEILSNIVASQIDFHARFGGVVPEIASRKHIEAVVGVLDEALETAGMPLSAMDALAVTTRPGLVGALVVGLAFMKGLAYGCAKPLYGINHLEGHIYANVLAHPDVAWPLVALVVSGGHTSLIYSSKQGSYETLGETLDDAAGEAFDKVAKALGLPYPGGPIISKLAEAGNPHAIDFPRAMLHSGDYQFSLSGLKTAVITYIHQQEQKGLELNKEDIAASFQQAVVEVQVAKAVRAVKETGAKWFLLAGGVSANPALRQALIDGLAGIDVQVSVPPLKYCTDNAAMIARAAVERVNRDEPLDFDAEAQAHAPLDDERALRWSE